MVLQATQDVLGASLGEMEETRVLSDFPESGFHEFGLRQGAPVEIVLDLPEMLGQAETIKLNRVFQRGDVLGDGRYFLENIDEPQRLATLRIVEFCLMMFNAVLVEEGFSAEVRHVSVTLQVGFLKIVQSFRELKYLLGCSLPQPETAGIGMVAELSALIGGHAVLVHGNREVLGHAAFEGFGIGNPRVTRWGGFCGVCARDPECGDRQPRCEVEQAMSIEPMSEHLELRFPISWMV